MTQRKKELIEQATEVLERLKKEEEPVKEIATQTDTKLQEAQQLKDTVSTFLLGNSLTKKLEKEQIDLCIQTAVTFGLNPLKREIHFVPRYNSEAKRYDVNVIIGYEVYIKRADRTGKLNGWGVKFEGTGGAMKAIIEIYRKGWEKPFVHEVWAEEARQNTPVWNKMPRFMLRKTVISQGFKLAFPEELAGLPYTAEELGIGVVDENGNFKAEQKIGAPSATPIQLISPAKVSVINDLLKIKGKDQKPILDFYRIKTLNELNMIQADRTITQLNSYPDKAEFKFDEPQVNVDEVAKALDKQEGEGK